MGVYIALDDFGTGYSSLGYLRELPISRLKIDRSFVNKLQPNTRDSAILESIINLASKLDIKITGEGVETLEQLNQLNEMNCDFVQGYYFSKPLDSEKAFDYFEQMIGNTKPSELLKSSNTLINHPTQIN